MKLIAPITCIVLGSLMISGLALAGGHGGHAGHSAHNSHHTPHSPSLVGTGSKQEKTPVSDYTKKNGTHVAAHNRSTRDETQRNNWSAKGNVNPDTGKVGTKAVTH